MSRKKLSKSNIQIGIFQDKSRLYNRAILEVLYNKEGATARQIAKEIQPKYKPITKEQERFDKPTYIEKNVNKIYSIIQRPNGRLLDLEAKNYIVSNEGLWSITFKGTLALAIIKPELTENAIQNPAAIITAHSNTFLEGIPDGSITLPFGITIDRSQYKKDTSKLLERIRTDPSILRICVEEIKQLLRDGMINLDVITTVSLGALLSASPQIKKALQDIVKALT